MELNYPEVGATRAGPMPPGYRHLERTAVLDAPLAEPAEILMTWGLHERCGLHPEATGPRAAVGVEVALRFAGVLKIPCRVVWAEESPAFTGFGHGSLPGHPERGEAAFVLEAEETARGSRSARSRCPGRSPAASRRPRPARSRPAPPTGG
nr:hypothetical protein GCM10025732_51950 [Glycomyces mayteni]